MTLAVWIFMATSMAAVLSFATWCYTRILREGRTEERDRQAAAGERQ